MKKVINNPGDVVEEMLEGIMRAHHGSFQKVEGVNGIVKKELKDKVAVVTGGGSGHEPLFFGVVGDGLADGVAIGNVFAAPTPNTVQEVAKTVDSGKGVLFIYGNYAGDVLNFDMAAELLEFEDVQTTTVKVTDDVVSAPLERKEDRRGIAGDIFVIKVAGAAAEKGLSLEEVTAVSQKANEHTYSIGVALSPGTIPDSGEPTFTLADDEIELGMGIHGEPGMERTKLMPADELTNQLMEKLLDESQLTSDDEVSVLINGLGSTTLMELFIVNRKVAQILDEKGIGIHDIDVNNYCTTQEMGGFSISLLELDDELKAYYDAPANAPYYKK
ncbi:PTS-dependent dihydroxyacetone kinase, dihydroxyacetone-binding subunit DhaK [Oceanobacillus oncorhynchi]|uniref:PTS-dependent dihydroxyacetone kinase, dihydroxyacetone-binding subunit DhaK n=1 Tax=Oceanobacillus oncorhynchi TaxID=545501 RepID=A0A0A1MPM3_9BACI|nr:dihydroxyacetone kinase subunit DhaK [Oceanobacillus oncorhynchi]CEI81704.1 PTS-dependent dihydroxyacetone kinase, dihydroxyacetone-binding subunit DhaK [Oceanobacillus oncorhynchi]